MTQPPSTPTPVATAPAKPRRITDKPTDESLKETFESVIIAFILAFIFRAYVVEAFVIPTGSMAPVFTFPAWVQMMVGPESVGRASARMRP